MRKAVAGNIFPCADVARIPGLGQLPHHMCTENTPHPSLYGGTFDAKVQYRRSLTGGRRNIDCPSAQDSGLALTILRSAHATVTGAVGGPELSTVLAVFWCRLQLAVLFFSPPQPHCVGPQLELSSSLPR